MAAVYRVHARIFKGGPLEQGYKIILLFFESVFFTVNHNYNKILKSDWLSTALISVLIGQFNRTVCVMPK